jgi:hypothetical protein
MHPVIAKTFGGLSKPYYFRQFFFGLLFLAFILFASSRSTQGMSLGTVLVVVINTLLYPYARFVYESVVGFITGNNVFFVNALLMMFVKLMTMTLCWAGALFIAPVGLAYLYYHHSKNGG